MTIFATLGGLRIAGATVSIPMVGAWSADVTLTNASAPSSTICELKIGTLSLVGFIFRAAEFLGTYRARVVGGRGGWRRVVPPKGYTLTGGVTLSTVLGDIAREVGEVVKIGTDRSLGTFYSREGGPAQRPLNRLCPSWYTNAAGETVIGDRPGGAIVSPFDVISFEPPSGLVTVGVTEAFGDWLPGRTFRAPVLEERTIRASTVLVGETATRVQVLT